MNRYGRSLYLMISLFFIWGFLTSMNDVLMPFLQGAFVLSNFAASLVQFAFFISYFVGGLLYLLISLRSGDPIQRIGYKNGVILGLLISAVGALLFYPAAELEIFPLFLVGLFLLGFGFTLLQISANPYVAVLGSPETASSRLNLAQAFNSIGHTLAPVIGGSLMFSLLKEGEVSGSVGADAVKFPYLGFGLILLLIALLFRFVSLPELKAEQQVRDLGALRKPWLVLGAIGIFFYVGVEVCIGSYAIRFLQLEQIAGFDKSTASHFLSIYLGGMMTGRFLGAFFFGKMEAEQKYLAIGGLVVAAPLLIGLLLGWEFCLPFSVFLLINLLGFAIGRNKPALTTGIFALIGAAMLVTGAFSSGSIAMWAVLCTGLFNSVMWSNIFTLAIQDLGIYTSQGSSILIMAIIGGALMPPLMGLVADAQGIQLAYLVPVISYAYIAFYGFVGHKIGIKQSS